MKDSVVSDSDVIKKVNVPEKKSVGASRMRRIVDYVGQHPFWRRPFFWTGFLTFRLLYPVQYLLIRELMDCESVLDLGCGRHSMIPIIPSFIRTTGVELFEPHYREAVEKARHDKLIQADITKIEFEDNSFDAVVLMDVIEHLSKDEGEKLIKKLERWARKKVIVFTPNGFLHQDEYADNPYMVHQSGWECAEFKNKGFCVYGVRGFKNLVAEDFHEHDHEEHKEPTLRERLVDLTQIMTYHIPSEAFQLFCVKNIS